jgi:hypothetical protein
MQGVNMFPKILQMLLNLVTSYMSKPEAVAQIQVSVDLDTPAPSSPELDWNNPDSKISKYFTVKEALYLPSWDVMHIPSQDEKNNILKHAQNMDKIREFLGAPINVHCWIRPILNNPQSIHHGEDYNALVKGAKNSSHKYGLATDYDAKGLNCDNVRTSLEPKLEGFGLRMEKMRGGNWVHNDSSEVPVGGNRYFIP